MYTRSTSTCPGQCSFTVSSCLSLNTTYTCVSCETTVSLPSKATKMSHAEWLLLPQHALVHQDVFLFDRLALALWAHRSGAALTAGLCRGRRPNTAILLNEHSGTATTPQRAWQIRFHHEFEPVASDVIAVVHTMVHLCAALIFTRQAPSTIGTPSFHRGVQICGPFPKLAGLQGVQMDNSWYTSLSLHFCKPQVLAN